MANRREAIGVILTALLAFGAGALASRAAGYLATVRQPIGDRAELTLFPSGQRLGELSLGHRQLLADVGWLAAIQYYGKHRQGDRCYPLAEHLFSVVTGADPHFRNAYLFGALVLAEAGAVAEGADLLRRGVLANPASWRLRFELGFYHYVITRSWSEALAAFRAAAATPGAAPYVLRFAAAAGEKAERPAVAAELWQTIAMQSENDEIQRVARDRLARLAEGGASQTAPRGEGSR